VDGIFETVTGNAVSAFKTDMEIAPADPVVGPGTMTALDDYYSWEPADPDSPDPSTAGIIDQVAGMIDAVPVIHPSMTIEQLNRWPSGETHPDDPDWVWVKDALQRHFKLDQHAEGREHGIDEVILPVLHAGKRGSIVASSSASRRSARSSRPPTRATARSTAWT